MLVQVLVAQREVVWVEAALVTYSNASLHTCVGVVMWRGARHAEGLSASAVAASRILDCDVACSIPYA
jgi:hypothetical protein